MPTLSEEPEASKVTKASSFTVWSEPAFAVGLVTSSRVMMTVSVAVLPARSVTFNVIVYVPGVAKVYVGFLPVKVCGAKSTKVHI